MNVQPIRSKYLKEFIWQIQYVNPNPKDLKALKLIDDCDTNPEISLPIKTKLYRGRIIEDKSTTNKTPNFYGYDAESSFAPPPNITRDMRANYRYIPYLYCANNPYTALVEV